MLGELRARTRRRIGTVTLASCALLLSTRSSRPWYGEGNDTSDEADDGVVYTRPHTGDDHRGGLRRLELLQSTGADLILVIAVGSGWSPSKPLRGSAGQESSYWVMTMEEEGDPPCAGLLYLSFRVGA